MRSSRRSSTQASSAAASPNRRFTGSPSIASTGPPRPASSSTTSWSTSKAPARPGCALSTSRTTSRQYPRSGPRSPSSLKDFQGYDPGNPSTSLCKKQVAAKEVDLVGDQRLVLRAVVDVEVIDTRVGAQLALRRPPCGGDRGVGPGDAVGLANANQPGAVELGRVPDRPVGPAEQPAGGNTVAPAGVLAGCDHLAPALLSTGSVDECDLVRLAHSRNVPASHRRRDRLERHARRGSVCLAHDVEKRHLADGGRDVCVARGGSQCVAAAHRGAERRHPGAIDSRQGAREGDGTPPVLELTRRVEEVLLPTAVAEAAVVEYERCEASRRKALGEWPEPVAPRSRKTMCHDHDR